MGSGFLLFTYLLFLYVISFYGPSDQNVMRQQPIIHSLFLAAKSRFLMNWLGFLLSYFVLIDLTRH